ncbi:MAG: protein translocase subunit SecF [SAR324 cluster bacterium]|nr:protein translocase subunit SecF [SAR324 cluster bacterium]
MRIIKEETHFNFLAKGPLCISLSGLLVLAGIVAYFAMGGLNYGVDFRGGTDVQVQFKETIDIKAVRQALSDGEIGSFSLKSFGQPGDNEFLISLGKKERTIGDKKNRGEEVKNLLKAKYPSLTVRRIESVGPRVGKELRLKAAQAIVFSLIAILLYVWLRFQWRYSIGALVALFHDVLIVMIAFVVTGKEVTLPVVAAILTIAGYSINDTIVIFDRIRENLRRYQKKEIYDIFNQSVNQTLSRTILTSGTTLFVVLAIYFFGGAIINDFAFALVLGVVVGTYSSIFIAAPIVHNLMKWFPAKIR